MSITRPSEVRFAPRAISQTWPTETPEAEVKVVGLSHCRVWRGVRDEERRMEEPKVRRSLVDEYRPPELEIEC
jgi:hypothetical protein